MKSICTAFFLVLIIASCGKAIPGETMDGRGTFYCKVNGEDYFPDCQGFACQDVRAVYSTFGDAIDIGANRQKNGEMLDIYIYVYNISSSYSITEPNSQGLFSENTVIYTDCDEFNLVNSTEFDVQLSKVDFQNGTISGTFSGTIRDSSTRVGCGYKEFVLTDGIFDLPITF